MRRALILCMSVLALMGLMTGCGEKEESKTADLESFYTDLASRYEWGETYMVDLEGELLESYYPGITEYTTKQLIAKAPQMSSVVNELVFVECETKEDADQVAEILQKRIDDQANGGAWYPESMEAWSNGQVLTEDCYVAMIASAEHQDEIEDSFTGLFA